MEPRIQYVKTEDGVSIAYWTFGNGQPLVFMPRTPFSHIQAEWKAGYQTLYERLANGRMLVRYDSRGSGLSERKVTDYSLAAQVRDLEAIGNRLDVARFDVLGYTHSGPVAIAYAARHPERVAHLVLWQSWIRSTDVTELEKFQGLMAILQTDWELFRETSAQVFYDWVSTEAPRRWAAFMGECITHEGAKEVYEALRGIDIEALLPKVAAPTLVMQVRDAIYPGIEVSRELTTKIPDARLALLEGTSLAPFQNDVEAVVQAIDEFLGGGDVEGTLPEGMTAILLLDIADSTALTTKLGDAAYREKERELDTALRAAITEAGGTPVEGKVLGDGVMAVFTSARQAIDAAQRCRDLGNGAGLPLHLGIHAGDVVREGNNVHGGAVQVASRVQSVAAPGEVLVSQTVRDLARTSADVQFEDRGEHELKGIAEPQRLFTVQAEGSP